MAHTLMETYGVWKQVGLTSWVLVARGVPFEQAQDVSDQLKIAGHVADMMLINREPICACRCHATEVSV